VLKSFGRPRWPLAPGSLPSEHTGQNSSFYAVKMIASDSSLLSIMQGKW